MPFVTYQPNTRMRSNRKEVRLTKSGFITLSAALVADHVGEHGGVQLLYDAEGRRIAIKPVPAGTENSMKLSIPKGSLTRRISASGFLEFCGIKLSKNTITPAEWDQDLGAVVFTVP